MNEVNSTIICPNCGGIVDTHAQKCPYCGYINAEGAEEKYMEQLESVKDRLDDVDDSAVADFGKSMGKSLKLAIVVIAIVVIIIGSLFAVGNALEKHVFSREATTVDDEIAKLKQQRELFPKLDELFESGDYEGLCNLCAEGTDGLDIWNYENYEFVNAYRYYMWIRDAYEPRMSDGKLDDGDAAYLINHCMYFYFECYKSLIKEDNRFYAKDIEVLDDIRESYIMPMVRDRMGFSDEELSVYDTDEIGKHGYVDMTISRELGKKYYKRFK